MVYESVGSDTKADPPANSTTCPICGEGHLIERQEPEACSGQGHKMQIPLAYSVCDSCASEQASPEQLRVNKRSMIKFQNIVDGLLPGKARNRP
jgi:hypothetical protein